MVPGDLSHLRTPSAPTLTPDGRLVAVAVGRIDLEADQYRADLWLVPTDGSTPPRRFTSGRRDVRPQFSPDGRWLAFLRAGDDDKPQLWVMATDGGEPRRVCEHPLGVEAFAWSLDPDRLCRPGARGGPLRHRRGRPARRSRRGGSPPSSTGPTTSASPSTGAGTCSWSTPWTRGPSPSRSTPGRLRPRRPGLEPGRGRRRLRLGPPRGPRRGRGQRRVRGPAAGGDAVRVTATDHERGPPGVLPRRGRHLVRGQRARPGRAAERAVVGAGRRVGQARAADRPGGSTTTPPSAPGSCPCWSARTPSPPSRWTGGRCGCCASRSTAASPPSCSGPARRARLRRGRRGGRGRGQPPPLGRRVVVVRDGQERT